MAFSIQKLSYTEVLELLNKAENSFTPPLSHNIPYTLEEYALRLANYAMFVICKDNADTIGFLAYYENYEGRYAYIPQIWVSGEYQRQGIGSLMLCKMNSVLGREIRFVRLEVRMANKKAYGFYLKSGFIDVDEKDSKFIMEKQLQEG